MQKQDRLDNYTSDSDIVKDLVSGKRKPRDLYATLQDKSRAARILRMYLESSTGSKLEHIGSATIDYNDTLSRNTENVIGAVQVPLGYAGKLKVEGDYAKGTYPILFATTEGRLVAGASRALSATLKFGRITTRVIRDGMARDILVRCADLSEAAILNAFVNSAEGFKLLKEEFSKHTKHGSLSSIECYPAGRDVHLRFIAATGAAMGMNMVTIASSSAAGALVSFLNESRKMHLEVLGESGNMCADKKPSYIDVLRGRGVSVIAEVRIPVERLKQAFGCDPNTVLDLEKAKNHIGSELAGSNAFNAHVANTLAAMYIEYGQDPAQIAEGSQAVTDVAIKGGFFYLWLYMPAIEVGTVGGGTARETQKEALGLLNLGDPGSEGARKAFAEIVAATCAANELNLLAVEASATLSKSHSELQRG